MLSLQEGKHRLFELGKYLQRRYRNLLKNRPYSSDLIYVRSSNMRRTRESAAQAMAGFFDYEKHPKRLFLKNLFHKRSNDTVQSVPVNAVPREEDHLLYFVDAPCPLYVVEEIELITSTEPEAIKKYQKLLEYLEANTGQPVRDLSAVYTIYDTLFVEKSKNFP